VLPAPGRFILPSVLCRHILSEPFGRKEKQHMNQKLVVYFSATGTTRRAAKKVASQQDADLYEITPEVLYTGADLDWTNKKSRSTIEMADKDSRPKLAGQPADIASYSEIWLGFPIWWGVAPHIINTFLELYDFTGKTIHPFATSGGSGYGKSSESLKMSARGAEFEAGVMVR